ncbi:MAG: SsrA-binding protein [Candidatus Portnoybacteria bacterium RIFCSPLOWO2_12_FULL_39_9]|uniref:SsrA-binding protein n=1 Tax=Candidatus Portnoybacteria bacterium RIFCSPHIGHO2_12_FULL_38_9 TaxID=1801997 RepID=A0A1G2FHD1_9BACT|nr:MAG: SsrA-binding protein [Candidatus Portnoybacteria bacterium RIFCSPHIGHO2_02_FULL_39_12]OGZ37494.1 MAG: SsrA-binding protein [Candidatus Portnoybacteria bacterium RIFCSPHIGHO2_12_FULL_38_9]OGZ39140.1 MAG: SsrA-binding protein [Candidatus Portnoybacteria bacterium RIFCSPLOWO2_01_FULL_38_39]OGZ39834.1 MAG: SsrA-binding protein [Candidatus Portnoybacteria bacterium RIFCSPLOWO2_12_FULL_39_9]
MPTLAVNPRAKYDYEILETYEAGIVLAGYEVKAVKTGHLSLKGTYVAIKNNEAFLINAHISPYQPKNTPADYEPNRLRKLLLNKQEIKTLIGRIKQKGLTLAPLRVYTKRGMVKLEFAVGKGKRKIDKREKIKKREAERKMERALKVK